jgi:putative addiction module component (TIGR02574 family)
MQELMDEVISLPLEARARLADVLLNSLNRSDPEIDRIWAEEATKRLEEIRRGKVKTVPIEEVFEKLSDRWE